MTTTRLLAGGGVLLSACLGCETPGFDLGWKPNEGQRPGAPTPTSEVEVYAADPGGWASVDDLGQNGTTGGGDAEPVTVTTFAELEVAVAGTTPAVVVLGASVAGSMKIGSHKTLTGMPGVAYTGHIGVSGSANVIVRDLKIVGNNCAEDPDCQSGDDAVTIDKGAHHVWFDHCDISDGSDGNLDVASAADYVTISWTKFSYSGFRAGGHQFSNLIGSSDGATGDRGHLRVTFHHDWWAEGATERMPRARYGQIHLYNNLYTSHPNSYCVGVGASVNVLVESTVFDGVTHPVNTQDFANAESVEFSFANLYLRGSAPSRDVGAAPLEPPYPYVLQPAAEVQATVMANAGPHG